MSIIVIGKAVEACLTLIGIWLWNKPSKGE